MPSEFAIDTISVDVGIDSLFVGRLSSFHRATTKAFDIVLLFDDLTQNITRDTVTVTVKKRKADADDSALIKEIAEVLTEGGSGKAKFKWTPLITDIEERKYVIDIRWDTVDGNEYIVYDNEITCLPTVSRLI